ncbi:hypothetical protein [Acidithrix sp. C25]|uniref:hypothetical protein n=1 Tax=Acidithrix sp. C25 TaxID=1671482 RepID=UPI00191B9246|nr:hypothetical protein [Acidithrix sp. C25]CAG4902241.1 unnamed protein product [Acidithrix sp. C25]
MARIEDQFASLDANFGQVRAVLADTLDLTRDCHTAYLEAGDNTRRLFNQAFFAKIYIDEDEETREQTVRVDYSEPFDTLLSRLIPASVHRTLDIEKTAPRDILIGGLSDTLTGTEKVQGSHTDTLVVLARLFSNSTPSALCRAINAYRQLDLSRMICKRVGRVHPNRAKRLSDTQLARLVDRYESGATVYELASEFLIDRRTVSIRLKQQGVIMRLQPPAEETVDEIVRLYESGLSMSKVGQQVGYSADSVGSHLRKRRVKTREPR